MIRSFVIFDVSLTFSELLWQRKGFPSVTNVMANEQRRKVGCFGGKKFKNLQRDRQHDNGLIQSIPAAPSPALPWLLRGICPPFQSRGWGSLLPCASWRPSILCHPPARGFLSQYNNTEEISRKKADWLICQGQEVVKAFSRLEACISSLLIKPE